MNFNIGDKVKIIANDNGSDDYIGRVGIIIETDRIKQRISMDWDYRCEFDDGDSYPFNLQEIEKVVTKGQQLLFSFME